MGLLGRWNRKLQKEEKYVNSFNRIFWTSIILAIGWGLLWTADTRYSYQKIPMPFKNDVKEKDSFKQISNNRFLNESHPSTGSIIGISEQILTNKSFITSYNKDTKNPNWCSWELISEHTNGLFSREGEPFTEDYRVPQPRATLEDYRGSGFDRGHMCPAGDNRWDGTAMYESFLLTNICPQNHELNKHIWNEIEQLCRIWAKKYEKIYIVCGPLYFEQPHRYIGINKIMVPDAFFKVVMRKGYDPQGIGFICENKSEGHHSNLIVTPIKTIEQISGFTFFDFLIGELSAIIKEECHIERWYGTSKFIRQHNL